LTNYSRGAAFERKIKKQYEAEGYYVIRSAGSKGPLDLVALKHDSFVFIQCKLRKPTSRERAKAADFAGERNIIVTLIWPGGQEEVIG
jgi:Holliday junction resolvase